MTLWPFRRTTAFLLGLLLIDLPILVAVLAVGHRHGYQRTYTDIQDWRLQHPWSLVPTVAVAAAAAYRILRRDG